MLSIFRHCSALCYVIAVAKALNHGSRQGEEGSQPVGERLETSNLRGRLTVVFVRALSAATKAGDAPHFSISMQSLAAPTPVARVQLPMVPDHTPDAQPEW